MDGQSRSQVANALVAYLRRLDIAHCWAVTDYAPSGQQIQLYCGELLPSDLLPAKELIAQHLLTGRSPSAAAMLAAKEYLTREELRAVMQDQDARWLSAELLVRAKKGKLEPTPATLTVQALPQILDGEISEAQMDLLRLLPDTLTFSQEPDEDLPAFCARVAALLSCYGSTLRHLLAMTDVFHKHKEALLHGHGDV